MSKLFKLKEWVTVPDAARHLSIIFGEEVTEADVLRLALDKQLRLSIRFVNFAYARCGEFFRYSRSEWEAAIAAGYIPKELEMSRIPPVWDADFYQVPDKNYIMRFKNDNAECVAWSDKIHTLSGVYDLPLAFAELAEVEKRCQELTSGPDVRLTNVYGAVVVGQGCMWQLQESLDNNEYIAGSRAQLESLQRHIADKNIGEAEAEKLLNRYKEERKKFVEKSKFVPDKENYFAVPYLPEDSVLVVRTAALREFEARLTAPAKKPESTRKTENLIQALTCIAIDAYGYDPQSGKNSAPKDIADAMSVRGFSKDEKTIRSWLKEGADLLPPIPHKG